MIETTVSYAQNREDIIIDAFFDGKNSGFYVDVGANHPVQDSVTKLFYEKGWRGINIEPNQELADLLRADRPRDIIVQKGVSDKKGSATLRQYTNADGLSTYSDTIKDLQDDYYARFKQTFVDVETEVDTLAAIIDEFAASERIDFLKIDVEGFEYEVLLGFIGTSNPPELICIEANHIEKDWRPLLKQQGYVCFFNDGLNDYYALEGSKNMKDFSFPEKVFMRYPKIVPFIANAHTVRVSDAIFSEEPTSDSTTDEVTNKQAIKWSLLSIDSAVRAGLTNKILQQKYLAADRAVERAMNESGQPGFVTKHDLRGGARGLLLKASLIVYSVTVKIARRLSGVLVR